MHPNGIKIADSVHGTVQLSALEASIVDSAAFQRLRGIRHLGLASLVFPGADYSRLSHGVGTCHVTGKILSALRSAHPGKIEESDFRLYRAAALLHDVGHYPFSHTFEHALRDHYKKTAILAQGGNDQSSQLDAGMLLHEDVGKLVISSDPQLVDILTSEGIDPADVARIITRADEPPKFTNLVSSDLDADRIDYLLRTAAHTGLPYGHVDLEYLLTQIRLDADDRICYTAKGMRAAEHLLLCRFFDYAQVSFHKTVAALELVLNEAIGALLRTGTLECSTDNVKRMIDNGEWHLFDDSNILGKIRMAMSDGSLAGLEQRFCKAVLDRRPPKLLFEQELFGGAAEGHQIETLAKIAGQKLRAWEGAFETKIWLWNRSTQFTKIGPNLSLSQHQTEDDETYDKIMQAVLILPGDATHAIPIQEDRRSLMPVLTANSLHAFRVYALTVDQEPEDVDKLRARVHKDLDSFV